MSALPTPILALSILASVAAGAWVWLAVITLIGG
jgi:hypothetical protein